MQRVHPTLIILLTTSYELSKDEPANWSIERAGDYQSQYLLTVKYPTMLCSFELSRIFVMYTSQELSNVRVREGGKNSADWEHTQAA